MAPSNQYLVDYVQVKLFEIYERSISEPASSTSNTAASAFTRPQSDPSPADASIPLLRSVKKAGGLAADAK